MKKLVSKSKSIISMAVLSLAVVSAPSFATSITGAYSCSEGSLVKLSNGETVVLPVSVLGEFGVQIMLKTALSLMETKNDNVTYNTSGYVYMCGTSGNYVSSLGSK